MLVAPAYRSCPDHQLTYGPAVAEFCADVGFPPDPEQELALEMGYGKAIHHVLRQLAERARTEGRVPTAVEAREILEAEFYAPFANKPAWQGL